MADIYLAKLGKSLWAAFCAVSVNAFVCLIIEAVWHAIVLRRGLTGGYYNAINYAGDAAVLILGGLALAVVVGLPVQAVMQHFGFMAWGCYSLPAACVTAAMACIFTSLAHYQRHPLLVSGICFGLGFAGGTLFWLIRRPDKDAAT